MSRKYLKNSWRKLDNTAKIFSLDYKNNPNVFRFSVILKQNVDKNILERALEKSLEQFLAFKVKIGTGLFWNYLEFNPKEPLIKEENQILCKPIDFKKNNNYLFKVTYCKKKINLDIFHVLTDGMSAIKFFKSIIYNYINLKNNLLLNENIYNNISYQDQYLNNYDRNVKENLISKKAYQLPQKYNKNINNIYHYTMNINEIKSVCKTYKVTITEYLTAIYIYSIYLSLYNKNSKKEIVITVPIDLRSHYQVDTLSNFFLIMNINPKIKEKKLKTFNDILKEVCNDFKEKLNKEKIKIKLSKDVRLGTNIFIRMVPLFIKKIFITHVGPLIDKSSTSTLSNVGIIDVDDKYKKYINNILVSVIPGKSQKIKCTVCSFDNKLNVIINSNIDDIEFENTFFKLLKEKVGNIKKLKTLP